LPADAAVAREPAPSIVTGRLLVLPATAGCAGAAALPHAPPKPATIATTKPKHRGFIMDNTHFRRAQLNANIHRLDTTYD
jgi:hypothetical protein